MPRVSEAEKQKSRARILDAAAVLFREKGIAETSVAEIMKAAGMTHGGFYRHFQDKDALVAAAFRRAVDTVVAPLEAETTPRGIAAAREAYIGAYLSRDHVDNRGTGCPIAALGSEIARTEGAIHEEASATVKRVAALLQDGSDPSIGYARLSLLVGAVTLSRMVNDPALADTILDASASAAARLG